MGEIKTLEQIANKVSGEYGMSGLFEGVHKDFVTEVAKEFAQQFISMAIKKSDENWWAGKKEMTMGELVQIENLINQNI